MKAQLKFNLSNPEDLESFRRCTKATDMACVLFEFSVNKRKVIAQKIYNNKDKNKTSLDIMYEEFNTLMEEFNLNIDELIT